MFLAGVDITLKRFHDTTSICGYIPRPCFAAALSPDALLSATREILEAIDETENLVDTITKVHNGRPIHRYYHPPRADVGSTVPRILDHRGCTYHGRRLEPNLWTCIYNQQQISVENINSTRKKQR